MNVQKIFKALEEDNQNSALGIICNELESQGYKVKINERPVSSESFFNGDLPEIEKVLGPLNFSILINGKPEQRFSVEFLDFHEIAIKKTRSE